MDRLSSSLGKGTLEMGLASVLGLSELEIHLALVLAGAVMEKDHLPVRREDEENHLALV